MASRFNPSEDIPLDTTNKPCSSHLLMSNQLLRVLEIARSDATVTAKVEQLLSDVLHLAATDEEPSRPPSFDLPDEDDSDVIDVRDPVKPIKTKGRPKELKRFVSHSEKTSRPRETESLVSDSEKPLKKPRHCGICQKEGHYRTKCPQATRL